MQASFILTVPAALLGSSKKLSDFDTTQLTALVDSNAQQIAYMLQSYYSREKLSHVKVVAGSISIDSKEQISLKLEYVMEEFNACSAVDTLKKDKMTVEISQDAETAHYRLTGEYWPERDGEL